MFWMRKKFLFAIKIIIKTFCENSHPILHLMLPPKFSAFCTFIIKSYISYFLSKIKRFSELSLDTNYQNTVILFFKLN